jgi:hypothetical protein
MVELLYDSRDDAYHQRIGSQILFWLDDVGAVPLDDAPRNAEGFLFAGARSLDDYRELVSGRPFVRDRPEEREPLLRLNTVLQALERASVCVPLPRTWVLPLDAPLPEDLSPQGRPARAALSIGGTLLIVAWHLSDDRKP